MFYVSLKVTVNFVKKIDKNFQDEGDPFFHTSFRGKCSQIKTHAPNFKPKSNEYCNTRTNSLLRMVTDFFRFINGNLILESHLSKWINNFLMKLRCAFWKEYQIKHRLQFYSSFQNWGGDKPLRGKCLSQDDVRSYHFLFNILLVKKISCKNLESTFFKLIKDLKIILL